MEIKLKTFDQWLASTLSHGNSPQFIFIIIGAAYILLPTQYWNYADDSIRWAYEISIDSGIINTHHLYLNILRPIYQLLSNTFTIDPLSFLSLYSSIFGIIGLFFLNKILIETTSKDIALLGVIFCATSAGYWSYSIVGDNYIPAVALMLGGFYYHFKTLTLFGKGRYISSLAASIAFFIGMILHHQALAIIVVGLSPGTLIATQFPIQTRLKFGIIAPALTGIITIGIYLCVYAYDTERNQVQTPTEYMAGYAETFKKNPDMKSLSIKSLANAAMGIGKSLLSSNFIFSSNSIIDSLQKRFPYRHIHSYPFLIHNLGTSTYSIIVVSIFICTIMLLILIPSGGYLGLTSQSIATPIFTASFVQMTFFIWWEAISDEFWIWFLPIATIAISIAIARKLNHPRVIYTLLIIPLMASTYLGSINIYQDKSNDLDLVNKSFVYDLKEHDLLIAMDEIISLNRNRLARINQGFNYFNIFVRASKGKQLDINLLKELIADTNRNGGTIYIGPYVSTPPKSYIELINMNNPDFIDEYTTIIGIINSQDNLKVKWIEAKVAPSKYFGSLSPQKTDQN
jgi:hypothetical protein